MDRTEIYYFSGTGNSLFAAKEIQKKIPNAWIFPIIKFLDKETIQTSAKTVGFVFPCHALTIPLVMKRFLRKMNFQSVEYVFVVVTRYGTVFRGLDSIESILKKKKKHIDSLFILNMCHNEAPRSERNYVVPSPDDIRQKEAVVLQKIDQIGNIVMNKDTFLENDENIVVKSALNPVLGFFVEKLVVSLMNISEYIGGVNYFYSDDKCNGCGVCEKVCLSGKIRLVDRKPDWQKDRLCFMCFACLNYCPQKSVQIADIPGVKSYTTENDRYPHPYATLKDIAAQKEG